jgi:hypothetical protein
MIRNSKTMLLAAALAVSGAASAATYDLPDPSIYVNPNVNGTTVVTVEGNTYRGPSAYVYVSECVKPDSPTYHCSILQETDVVLTATNGNTISVSILYQQASTLIRSGHNYYRQSQTVLDGAVITP